MFNLAQKTQQEWNKLLNVKTTDIHSLTPAQKEEEARLRLIEEKLSNLINPAIQHYNNGTLSASSLLTYLEAIHL